MSVKVENLLKKYGTQRAVDNISFEVKSGEIVGFLGPNGAGKTTTMKIITCYMAPNDGNVFVKDYSIYENPIEIKKIIGYLPESNPLYYDMYVLDYLKFVAELQGVEKNKIDQRVRDMVRLTGLNAEKHKKIGELSKGFKQRVGLAQAMIHDPEILILDEPTTGLDPNQIIEIRKLIKELGKQKTLILSTHILQEVEAVCDRIIIINQGKIVADGSAEILKKQAVAKEAVKLEIEGASKQEIAEKINKSSYVEYCEPLSEQNKFIVYVKDNINARRDIFEICSSSKWTLLEMSPIETKLEDIFRKLTLGDNDR